MNKKICPLRWLTLEMKAGDPACYENLFLGHVMCVEEKCAWWDKICSKKAGGN